MHFSVQFFVLIFNCALKSKNFKSFIYRCTLKFAKVPCNQPWAKVTVGSDSEWSCDMWLCDSNLNPSLHHDGPQPARPGMVYDSGPSHHGPQHGRELPWRRQPEPVLRARPGDSVPAWLGWASVTRWVPSRNRERRVARVTATDPAWHSLALTGTWHLPTVPVSHFQSLSVRAAVPAANPLPGRR